MKIHLIAVHYKDKKRKDISGFRLLDSDNGQVMDQPFNSVENVVKNGKATIHGICYDKELKGSNGSFDRYPALVNNNLLSCPIIILSSVDDVGYVIANFKGDTISASVDEAINFANKNGIANGKLVTKDNKQFISAIYGTYDNIPASKDARFKNIQENKKYADDLKQATKNTRLRTGSDVRFARVVTGTPNPNSKLKELDENTGMTVEQKMAYTLLALKHVRPFYYTIFNTLKRVEADEHEVQTMAVSVDTLYFSSSFVKQLSLQELLFIYIHEICHIAMKHRVREKGREHDVWNQACDYYINKCIADEFGLVNPGDIKEAKSRVEDANNTRYKICLPTNGLFNPNVDINVDTPESIYEEIMNTLNQNNQQNNQGSGESSDTGDESTGDGQSSGNSGQNSDKQSENGNSQGDSGESKDKNKESVQGNKNNVDNSSGDSDNDSGEDASEGSKSSKIGQGHNTTKKDPREGRLIGKEFRGQKITKTETDMVDDPKSKGLSQDQLNQTATSLLNRAVTVHRQSHQFGGDNADFLERYVEKALAPKINWLALLKSKLTKATQKVNTFAAPDKRFRSRNMIMPGPKALENDAIENIKICCDTSGSISPKDIGVALAQIDQLFKRFKADAEMIYWDTRVRAVYPFKDVKELVHKKPMGGGGTDVNCIFEYFENNRDYKIGKKKKPSIIVIFTDGYFGKVEDKYKKYRDVIWVVQGNDYFEPPFGVKAPFKNED